MYNVHGNSAPSLPTESFQVSDSKRGRRSTNDVPPPYRSKKVTISEKIDKIHGIVLNHPIIRLEVLAEIARITKNRVHNNIHEHFGKKKFTA